VKYILLLAFWTPTGLQAHAYEYAYRNECERVAQGWQRQAAQQTEKQIIEIWCYEVEDN